MNAGIPHAILISPDGYIRWQGHPTAGDDALSEELITLMLKCSKVPAASNAKLVPFTEELIFAGAQLNSTQLT
jgi:hypothetical protein